MSSIYFCLTSDLYISARTLGNFGIWWNFLNKPIWNTDKMISCSRVRINFVSKQSLNRFVATVVCKLIIHSFSASKSLSFLRFKYLYQLSTARQDLSRGSHWLKILFISQNFVGKQTLHIVFSFPVIHVVWKSLDILLKFDQKPLIIWMSGTD